MSGSRLTGEDAAMVEILCGSRGRERGGRVELRNIAEDRHLLPTAPARLYKVKGTSIYARSSLPPGPCPAEPLRTGKSQPKCGLFRTERPRPTLPYRQGGIANSERVKGCTIPYSG